MIFLDNQGYPTDQTSDGGDSAMRAGMLALLRFDHSLRLREYEKDGYCVRHPTAIPWNNPNNFTRDQLIPLTAGFYAAEMKEQARRVFFSHAKRLFFAQDIERDYPGSTKHPYPHTFTNDKGEKETRLFDFRDPLLPDHIFHLIKCARLYPLYIFGLIAIPWFILSMFLHGRSSHKEHNQIIAMAKVQGRWAEKLFMKWTPTWKEDLREYWDSRNEIEYAEYIIQDMEEV